jgi:hypothetical protein
MTTGVQHGAAVRRAAAIALIALFCLPQMVTARSIPNSSTPPGLVAPPLTGDLMEFLALVPDTAEYRSWVTWGNPQAWAQETGIGPLTALSDLDSLDGADREQWLKILPVQTQPPEALGIHYLARDDMASIFGFDYFAARQTLQAGSPPSMLTLVQAEAEPKGIAESLIAAGYVEQPMQGGALYARGEDNAPDLNAPALVAATGALNRIALLSPVEPGEATVAIARATETITNSAAARFDAVDSLADNSDFRAIVDALESTEPSEGRLVGLTFVDGPVAIGDAPVTSAWSDEYKSMIAGYAEEPLSRYSTAAFATFRGKEFTDLGVFLVLASGDDPSYVAKLLNERMDAYISSVDGEKLSDRWETKWIGAYQGEQNIAYVTVQLKPEEAHGLNWAELLARRDLNFLLPGD